MKCFIFYMQKMHYATCVHVCTNEVIIEWYTAVGDDGFSGELHTIIVTGFGKTRQLRTNIII